MRYKEEKSQLENNNLTNFNNINNTTLNTSEFKLKSRFIDIKTHIAGKIFNLYIQYLENYKH